jgi:hypothetical protein
MKLNLFEITVPPKVRRLYYYNPETQPEIFAKNMTRINNIRFIHSTDLVWVELPFLQTQILPEQSSIYKKSEELIENDEKLFIRTLYSFMEKLFKDNDFIATRQNLYISSKTKAPLKSNEKICYFESYQVKIYKINEKFYLSINPRFTFLSTKPALESEVKSIFVLNVKSGKSFPFVSAEKGKLIILLDKKTHKEVAHPEWYFFNFTAKEAEEFGFSKESYIIYNSRLTSLYGKIPTELSFLKNFVDIAHCYEVKPDQLKMVDVLYKFANGSSDDIRKIFQFKPLKSPETLKMTFLFPDRYKSKDIDEPVRRVFASSDSDYRRALFELGLRIEYLRNPQTNKAVFYYKEKSLDIEDKEFLSSPHRIHAIVLLDEKQESLEKLLKDAPKNIVVLPVLTPKITSDQTYILKSFAYKALNFSQDAQAYRLLGLSNGALYMGFDLSHDSQKNLSHYAFSAVDVNGKVLYINQRRDIPLNEKLQLEFLQEDIVKSIDRYKLANKKTPDIIFLMRDGVFLEDVSLLKNHIDLLKTDYIIIEINKNSNINSERDLKGMIIKLETNKYVYFAQTHNLQKAVEINIMANNSKLSDEQIAKEVYLTTKLFHATPYTNSKLPYPLYITDKVALFKNEWKLYIPYFYDM